MVAQWPGDTVCGWSKTLLFICGTAAAGGSLMAGVFHDAEAAAALTSASRLQHHTRATKAPLHGATAGTSPGQSILPFPELLRREMGGAHDRAGSIHSAHHHPQKYKKLSTKADILAGDNVARRRMQAVDSSANAEVLTVNNTEPFKVHIDWSGIHESTASPYSSCFRELGWFKWQYPSDSAPPCANPRAPTCGECPNVATCTSGNTLACWMDAQARSAFNPCDMGNAAPQLAALSTAYYPSSSNGAGVLCNRNFYPQTQNCWGVCLEEDVLSPGAMTDYVVSSVTNAVQELQTYFRSRPRTSNLVLSADAGQYAAYYRSKGVVDQVECGRDTRIMYRLPVNESYCSTGVDADVIFMPHMSQKTNGVAGWGAYSAQDQHGRPIVLVMGWSVPITAAERATFDHRAIVLHELVHGMGFSVYLFQNAFDSSGTAKQVVTKTTYADLDGTSEAVWAVVSPRVLEVARTYYAAPGLTSLPLLGDNQLGASQSGSHWESRIMDDEFLAYGTGSAVSAFTLAMMEDMGFYVGNYEAAQCMFWGRYQGQGFIESRCGTRRDDLTVQFQSALSSCDRAYPKSFGGTLSGMAYAGNAFIRAKCQRTCCETDLTVGCDRTWAAPPDGSHPDPVCNAECYTTDGGLEFSDGAGLDCGSVPSGLIVASGRAAAEEMEHALEAVIWAALLTATVVFVIFLLLAVHFYLHEAHLLLVVAEAAVNVAILLGGTACTIAGIVLLADFAQWETLFEHSDVVFFTLCSVLVVLFGSTGLCALWRLHRTGSTWMLKLHMAVHVLVCLGKLLLFTVVILWVVDSYSIETNTLATTGTTLDGQEGQEGQEGEWYHIGWEMWDEALDTSFLHFNGFACNTYRECCWNFPRQQQPPQPTSTSNASSSSAASSASSAVEEEGGSCMSTHTGATAGAVVDVLRDPSNAAFCATVTGYTGARYTGKQAMCHSYDALEVLDLDACAAQFCTSGVKGFRVFMQRIFRWARSSILWFGLVFFVLGLGDAVLFLASWALLFIEGSVNRRIAHGHELLGEHMTRRLRQAFAQFDTDDSGTLDLGELKQLLRAVRLSTHMAALDDAGYEAAFREIDLGGSGSGGEGGGVGGGDGVIEFEEFVAWWEAHEMGKRQQAIKYDQENTHDMVRKDVLRKWVQAHCHLGWESLIRTTGGVVGGATSLVAHERLLLKGSRKRFFGTAQWADGQRLIALLVACNHEYEDKATGQPMTLLAPSAEATLRQLAMDCDQLAEGATTCVSSSSSARRRMDQILEIAHEQLEVPLLLEAADLLPADTALAPAAAAATEDAAAAGSGGGSEEAQLTEKEREHMLVVYLGEIRKKMARALHEVGSHHKLSAMDAGYAANYHHAFSSGGDEPRAAVGDKSGRP